MKIRALRERIGLSLSEWAGAIGVDERTARRWENDGDEPSGAVKEIMRGISSVLDDGADPRHVGRIVGLGIAALIFYGLRGRIPS